MQAEAVAGEIIEIARNVAVEANAIAKARLEIDAIKWTAARMLPKKYGDKIEVGGSTGHQHMTLAQWDEFEERFRQSLA